MEPQETVLSEVHMETCPPGHSTWSTRFHYTLPPAAAAAADPTSSEDEEAGDSQDSVDSDGDLVLPRRQHSRRQHSVVVRHSLATPLSRCGEQVWLGACLLCDWVIANRQQLAGEVAVELGAGVGLVSLLLGTAADTAAVFLTDGDCGALQLAQTNVDDVVTAAAAAAAAAAGQRRPDIRVRRLDWLALFDTQLQVLPQADVLELFNTGTATSSPLLDSCRHQKEQQHGPEHKLQQQQQQQQERQQEQAPPPAASAAAAFCWSVSDLQLLSRTTLWLAADVVYDQTLTDAFMHSAAALMRWQQQQQQQQQDSPHPAAAASAAAALPPPRLLVAVEKRYCFTLHDMDATAPAFDHFLTYLQASESSLAAMPPHEQQRLHNQQQQQQEQQQKRKVLFRGERLDVQSIPQALQYDRSEFLELWELTLLP